MRQVRAPPKVTPPKPPAHLFEPREDVVPIRLEKKLDEAKPYNFEDDVKFQMQQLENEMKLMLVKDKGEPPAQALQLDRRVDPRASYGSQHGASEPFPERINPSDWRAKGFPSEYAYMKATGQLDMPSSKPIPQTKPQFHESLNPTRDSGYGLQNKQQSTPGFAETINPKDWKAKGFASEYAYMKATGQLDIPNNKPIPPMFDTNPANNRGSNPSFDPRNDPRNDLRGDPRSLSLMGEAPARPNERNVYEKEIVSPARRKGGAMQNLYVEEDEIRKKFANQHSYSDQLQEQAAQQRQAREAEQQAHRGLGAQRGNPREANMGMRLPSERGPIAGPGRPQQPDPYVPPPVPVPAARGRNEPPTGYRGGPETERYDPAALTYGADRTRAAAADPFHRSAPPGGLRQENPYEAKQVSPMDRRQGAAPPPREEVNTGLLLGLDKNSEKALKRAKQEEYKRQLDQMQQAKAQVPSPSAYSGQQAADSKSYLPTGARQAPERYDPRIPPAVQPAARAYPPAAYSDNTRPPPEYFSAATEGLREPYEPPMAAARSSVPPEYLNYSSGREARYPPSDYGSDAPGAYGGYPGPGPGAAGGRGGPSPLRQMPPAREDPYRQQAPPQNAPGGYPQGGRQAPSANFGASAVPAESQEKMRKRLEQEAYRRDLEAQMEIKKAQKSQLKKEEEQIDQKFLQLISAADTGNPQQRGKKGQGQGQQGDWQAPPAASQPAFQQPPPAAYNNPPPRAAPAVSGARGANGNVQVDDYAAEVEFLKAQLARLNQQDGHGPASHARADLFEREEERSFQRDGRDPRDDDRGDFDPRVQDQYRNQAAAGAPYNGGGGGYGREAQGPQGGGKQLDINTERGAEPSGGSATSPYKSPNQARTRMMKDIYGGDLITHSKPDPQQGGNWKSVGGMNDRKREIIAEQKAALDKQVEDDRLRKEQEKKDEIEKDRKKEERDRADLKRVADAELQEKRKKDQFNEDSARDLAELQQRKEQEALARKGRGAIKPAPQVHEEQSRSSNVQHNRGEPEGRGRGLERGQEQNQGRGAPTDYTPSAAHKAHVDYAHIESPVRDIIKQQHEQQLEMMMASRQSADYAGDRGGGGGAGRGGGISLYESATVDEMERFLQQQRANKAQDGGYGGGGSYGGERGYLPPQQQQYQQQQQQQHRGYEPSPYASYDRPPPGQQDYNQGRNSNANANAQYPYPPQNRDYPPYQQQAQHSPYRQQAPTQQGFYPARGNFYAPDNDISLVAESRLLPANPFSSSDILSSLVPMGATAHANASAQKQNKFSVRSEMEKSMASDSAMIYVGQRTPLLEPGATRLNLQEQAVAGMPSRKIHSSGRPSSSAATAKLSDVIEEANRVIEQEKRELHKGSAGSNRQPADRLAPKQDYSTEPTLLGEHDGISTVYRQDSRTHYNNNNANSDQADLNEVPKNRIFLSQKPRYEDEPTAPAVENEVAGYDDNFARSIQLLDSAEKAPRPDVKVVAEISTQTSALNLHELAAITAAAAIAAEPTVPSALKSPRKHKESSTDGDHKSSDAKKHRQKHSPRKSPRSPRVEEVLATEIDSEPVPIDGTFYTYGISPRADGLDTPDSYMSSMKYDPPFSPALAPQIAPTVVEGDAGEEGSEEAPITHHKNVLNASANIVKPVDHRSPRQRALDNKHAREAALASGAELPARRHKPVEEEFAEVVSPEVPRLPRKNILDANESLLQGPTDNRYRSPRQRALDRESSKKSNFSPRPNDEDGAATTNVADSTEFVIDTAQAGSKIPPEASPGPSESGFLPFVMNGSMDDTRFNEWPAEEHAVEVSNGSAAEEDYENDFPPEEYAQEPEHGAVGNIENTDDAAIGHQYESEYVADTQAHQDAPEDTNAWDNYPGEEVQPELTDATAYPQTQINPEYEQGYEQEYQQEYTQEAETPYEEPVAMEGYGADYAYEQEEFIAEADPADAPVEGGTEAEPTPTGYPGYPENAANDDEYSFVVESNMPYEYYEDEEEEPAEVPAATQLSDTEIAVAAAADSGAHEATDSAEDADAVNLAESDESQVPLDSARNISEEELPSDFLPEVVAKSSISRPTTGRPRTSNINTSREGPEEARPTSGRPRTVTEAATGVSDVEPVPPSRPGTSGRPRTGVALSSRVSEAQDQTSGNTPAVALVASRPPTSSRPRTDTSALSALVDEPLAVSRPATSGRPRTGTVQSALDRDSKGEDNIDAAPALSRPPTSSRPRSSAPLSSRTPGALEQTTPNSSTEPLAPPSSRPSTSGRPRTGGPSLSSQVPDALDQAIDESTDKPLLSRPGSSSARPRSAAPTPSREPDSLEQAINASSVSRPGTSSRLRAEAPPLSARAPDALEQALSDAAASRPPTSSRPRTGTRASGAHSPEIDALDQALAWSAPTTH